MRVAVYEDIVEYIKIPTGDTVFFIDDKKRFVWLQKIIMAVSKKICGNKVDMVSRQSQSFIEINENDIEVFIYKQMHNIMRRDLDIDMILIGRDKEIEFLKRFGVETMGFQDFRFKGIEVRLVPWIEGAVVVPKGN